MFDRIVILSVIKKLKIEKSCEFSIEIILEKPISIIIIFSRDISKKVNLTPANLKRNLITRQNRYSES